MVLKSAAEVAAQADDSELTERRRLSTPVVEEDNDLDKLATKAVWRAVSEFSPPRTVTPPMVWDERRVPSRCMLLYVLRHELGTVPRANDGSISMDTAMKLMPGPDRAPAAVIDALRPEQLERRAQFMALCDVDHKVHRVNTIEGHSAPFTPSSRWHHNSDRIPLSLVHGTREEHMVSIMASGLKPGGNNPGSRIDYYFAGFYPHCESDGRSGDTSSQEYLQHTGLAGDHLLRWPSHGPQTPHV